MELIHILTHPAVHSTGHYFSAAALETHQVLLDLEGKKLPLLSAGDLLLYIDPGPLALPLGIDRASCLRVAYLVDVHLDLEARLDLASLFDLVFVAQRDYVGAFNERGFTNSHWLPLACDPVTHYVPGLARDIDLGFIGKLGQVGTSRHELLTTILPSFQTNEYRRFYKPSEMGALYSRSKIVLNASINGDLNMRVFEAMASGALLITDRIQNGLADLFVEGKHYVAYSRAEEARHRITYYLQHEYERRAIARAGQDLVFAHHTYRHRWAEIVARIATMAEMCATRASLSRGEYTLAYAKVLSSRRDPLGLIQLMRRDGFTLPLGFYLARAIGKAINARVPVTPNAIRARMNTP